jgi:hypothetical protein
MLGGAYVEGADPAGGMGVGGGWIVGATSGIVVAGGGSEAALTGAADSAIGGAAARGGSTVEVDGDVVTVSTSSPPKMWVQLSLAQVTASAMFSVPHSGHVLVAALGSDIVTSRVRDGAYRIAVAY